MWLLGTLEVQGNGERLPTPNLWNVSEFSSQELMYLEILSVLSAKISLEAVELGLWLDCNCGMWMQLQGLWQVRDLRQPPLEGPPEFSTIDQYSCEFLQLDLHLLQY